MDVDLLDGLDGLDIHLLQRGLQLLVVGTRRLVDLLDLAAGSTLASIAILASFPLFSFFFGKRVLRYLPPSPLLLPPDRPPFRIAPRAEIPSPEEFG